MSVDVKGRFVWHELMTRDVAAAKQFYSQLLGWKPQAWPNDPIYTVNHSAEGPQSGFFPIPGEMPAEMPAHWVTYIGTRDVDGTAAAAVRAGGSIINGPADIKGAGRYAVLRDPQGATFAILDPENSRADPVGMPPVGSFSWHELATTDNEAAFTFYSELFGWEALFRHDMGMIGTYLIFGNGEIQRGGMFIKPAAQPGPACWLPYVSVANADSSFAVAQTAGGKALLPPMTVPGGTRIAQVMDPTGAAIALHSAGESQMAPAATAPTAKPKAKAKAKPKAKKTVKVAKPAAKKPVKRKAAKKKAAVKKKSAPMKKVPARKKAKAKKKVVRRKK
ncbi:MAG: VOC family protein [Nocardioides sp.]